MDLTFTNPYAARTRTYAALNQILAADLNAIQDGIIAVGAAVATLVAEIEAEAVSSSSSTANLSDSPAPDAGGEVAVWVEKKTNGTTPVTLDTSVDWRDRWLLLRGKFVTTDAAIPGGASDNVGDDDTAYSLPRYWIDALVYTRDGQTGSSSSTEAIRLGNRGGAPVASDYVVIYAHSTTGALMMTKTATADADVWVVMRVTGSPQQNHH